MSTDTAVSQHGQAIAIASPVEQVRITHEPDATQWRRFIDQHPQANIFHTPEMVQVFDQADGFHPQLWAAVRENGQILALFTPVQVTLTDIIHSLTTRNISYGSVLSLPDDGGLQALSLLLKNYIAENKRTCLFTELRNVSDLSIFQPVLCQQGFTYADHLNYLIDLKGSVEDVFQRIGARTRKNIRHGLNRGEVSIQEATTADQLNTCYNLISRTYQAARVPLASQSLFDAAFHILHPKNMIRFTLAYVGQTAVAVSIELLYKDIMYGWFGGMERAFSRYVPNELLMWHVLKWGVENGFSLYDFGGAGDPHVEYGVRDFKAKFGGNLVCYGRNTYVHRPALLWLSKQGYRIMQYLNINKLPG